MPVLAQSSRCGPRALPRERPPTRRRDDLPVPLVGNLRVCDRDPSLQAFQPLANTCLRHRGQHRVDLGIDRHINPAHEKTCDARNPGDVPPLLRV